MVQVLHFRQHLEGHFRHRLGVVGPGQRQAADEEVAVADGFDFLQPVPVGEAVETGEEFVEQGDEVFGVGLAGERGEVAQVREEDGDVSKVVGDGALAAFEALGNGLGEDVEQEAFGFFLLHFEELFLLLELDHAQAVHVAQPLALERGGDAGAQEGGINGLGKKVLRSQLDAADDGGKVIHAGGDDDREVAQEGVVLNRLEQVEAVHHRHLHVGDQEVEGAVAERGERGCAVARFGDVGVAQCAQREGEHMAHRVLVVGYEDGSLLAEAVMLGLVELLGLIGGEAAGRAAGAEQAEGAGVIGARGRVVGVHFHVGSGDDGGSGCGGNHRHKHGGQPVKFEGVEILLAAPLPTEEHLRSCSRIVAAGQLLWLWWVECVWAA